jgi:hypothetical protein
VDTDRWTAADYRWWWLVAVALEGSGVGGKQLGRCGVRREAASAIYRGEGGGAVGIENAELVRPATMVVGEKYLNVDSVGEVSAGIRGREVNVALWTRPVGQGRGGGELADVGRREVGGINRQWWWRGDDASAQVGVNAASAPAAGTRCFTGPRSVQRRRGSGVACRSGGTGPGAEAQGRRRKEGGGKERKEKEKEKGEKERKRKKGK